MQHFYVSRTEGMSAERARACYLFSCRTHVGRVTKPSPTPAVRASHQEE